MGGSARAEAQERNRAKVLAAAGTEFTERGFRDAKIDASPSAPSSPAARSTPTSPASGPSTSPSWPTSPSAPPHRRAEPRRTAARGARRVRPRLGRPAAPVHRRAAQLRPGSAWTCCPRSSPTSGPGGRSRSYEARTRSCSGWPWNGWRRRPARPHRPPGAAWPRPR